MQGRGVVAGVGRRLAGRLLLVGGRTCGLARPDQRQSEIGRSVEELRPVARNSSLPQHSCWTGRCCLSSWMFIGRSVSLAMVLKGASP